MIEYYLEEETVIHRGVWVTAESKEDVFKMYNDGELEEELDGSIENIFVKKDAYVDSSRNVSPQA